MRLVLLGMVLRVMAYTMDTGVAAPELVSSSLASGHGVDVWPSPESLSN